MAHLTKKYTMRELLDMANDRRISRAELLTELYGTLPHPAGYNPGGGGFVNQERHLEQMLAHGIDRDMARFIAFGYVERANTGNHIQNPNARHQTQRPNTIGRARNPTRGATYPPIQTPGAHAFMMNDVTRMQQAIEMSIAQRNEEMARRRAVRAPPNTPNQHPVLPGRHRRPYSAPAFIPDQVLSSLVSGGPSRNSIRPPPSNPAPPTPPTLNTFNGPPAPHARAPSPTINNTTTSPISEVPSLTFSRSSTLLESPLLTPSSSRRFPPQITVANPTLPLYTFGPVPTPPRGANPGAPASQIWSAYSSSAAAFAPRNGPPIPRGALTPTTILQIRVNRNAPNLGQALIREESRQQNEWAEIAGGLAASNRVWAEDLMREMEHEQQRREDLAETWAADDRAWREERARAARERFGIWDWGEGVGGIRI